MMSRKISETTQLMRHIVFLGSTSLVVALLCVAYTRTQTPLRKPMTMLQADQMAWPSQDDRVRFYKAARELGSDVMYENDIGDSDLYDSEFDSLSPVYPEFYPSMSPKYVNIEQALEQTSSGPRRGDEQTAAFIPNIQSRIISGMTT
jgi:hypothetical protein